MLLNKFASWFRSPAGIVQTIALVVGFVCFEMAYPESDPHGFWLLYWLTVYSAVTQPVLAYVADVAGKNADAMMNEELQLIKEELQLLNRIADDLEK